MRVSLLTLLDDSITRLPESRLRSRAGALVVPAGLQLTPRSVLGSFDEDDDSGASAASGVANGSHPALYSSFAELLRLGSSAAAAFQPMAASRRCQCWPRRFVVRGLRKPPTIKFTAFLKIDLFEFTDATPGPVPAQRKANRLC